MECMIGRRVGPQHYPTKYKVEKILGCGSFASVYQARICDGRYLPSRLRAIKMINLEGLQTVQDEIERHKQRVQQEVDIHKHLQDEYIIRFFESFEFENQMCIVMEHANGGNLHQNVLKFGCLPEISARLIFKQIYLALKYMHDEGFANMDVKMDNVLMISSTDVKLADFGLSKVLMDDGQVKGACGTPEYMAPELLSAPNKAHDGKGTDVHSAGVLLHWMVVGAPPIQIPEEINVPNDRIRYIHGEQLKQTHITIPSESRHFHPFPGSRWMQRKFRLTPEIKHLLARMLEKDPQSRITMEDIAAHPWMSIELPVIYVPCGDGLTRNLR
ncbi:hypothetical protein BSKO_06162 [Bryopsis sp. KO-2023]|nr:hypothetical protein BSKO_06162 [Bryopsis sp. KO-2023]